MEPIDPQDIQTSEELKSNNFTTTVAIVFVTLVLLGLFIKILLF